MKAIGKLYQFWPKSKPLPPGAKLISQFEGIHHGRYSVLIELPANSKDAGE